MRSIVTIALLTACPGPAPVSSWEPPPPEDPADCVVLEGPSELPAVYTDVLPLEPVATEFTLRSTCLEPHPVRELGFYPSQDFDPSPLAVDDLIAPGAVHTFVVEWAPAWAGMHEVGLWVFVGEPGLRPSQWHRMRAETTLEILGPRFEAPATHLDIPDVRVGCPSQERGAVFENVGAVDAVVTGYHWEQVNSERHTGARWEVTEPAPGSFPITVPPGETLTILARATPF